MSQIEPSDGTDLQDKKYVFLMCFPPCRLTVYSSDTLLFFPLVVAYCSNQSLRASAPLTICLIYLLALSPFFFLSIS